ncbi:MAG: HEAT repeat domain-containing protein [Chloroflexota bacterium]
MDPEFAGLIDTLLNSDNSAERRQAAKTLGDYVDDLNDEEYDAAKDALNRALTDADPMVLMAAMGALTKYNRMSGKDDIVLHGDDKDDILPPEKATCSVCGRPEALIPDGGCERDDCPYK